MRWWVPKTALVFSATMQYFNAIPVLEPLIKHLTPVCNIIISTYIHTDLYHLYFQVLSWISILDQTQPSPQTSCEGSGDNKGLSEKMDSEEKEQILDALKDGGRDGKLRTWGSLGPQKVEMLEHWNILRIGMDWWKSLEWRNGLKCDDSLLFRFVCCLMCLSLWPIWE